MLETARGSASAKLPEVKASAKKWPRIWAGAEPQHTQSETSRMISHTGGSNF